MLEALTCKLCVIFKNKTEQGARVPHAVVKIAFDNLFWFNWNFLSSALSKRALRLHDYILKHSHFYQSHSPLARKPWTLANSLVQCARLVYIAPVGMQEAEKSVKHELYLYPWSAGLKDKAGDILYFVTVNKSHEKTKTNKALFLSHYFPTSPPCLWHSASSPFVPTEDVNLHIIFYNLILKKKSW